MATRKRKGERGRSSRAGADEALTSLVNQFTDPLSFLRELIQNSLDAAGTYIEVQFRHEPSPDSSASMGIIEVVDNGEGMNEQIIDSHLLTLFSSSKEDDLTKIGKFGIGFVSIFAIEPNVVVLETGQSGESWRIVFHPDGNYEKMRLELPVEGTTVRLHKLMGAKEFLDLRRRGTEVVSYWCRYADAEILVDGRPVRQAFELDCDLAVHYEEPGTEIWIGCTPAGHDPLFGFYNRGLTLVEGKEFPGGESPFAGLSLRAKSRYLEHTLTRDNVRQDENFCKLLSLIKSKAVALLRARLTDHMCRLAAYHSAAADGPDPGAPGFAECARYAALPSLNTFVQIDREAVIPTVEGAPISPRALRRRRSAGRPVLVAATANPVTRLLAKQGTVVVRALEGMSDLLQGLKFEQPTDVCLQYCTAVAEEIPDSGDELIEQANALVRECGIKVDALHAGRLAYDGSRVAKRLSLRQERAFGLTELSALREKPLFRHDRQMVVNVAHPFFERCLQLARFDTPLAALFLAEAIVAHEHGSARKAASLAVTTLTLTREALEKQP
ncbi:MAG: hypothetical protein GF331_00615 [Chitinivibrionales bacterium]|nr:hypothetical protein [Chitinivibrionales bacterium]